MTETEVLDKVTMWLEVVFPDKPAYRPSWRNGSYRPMFFAIFKDAFKADVRVDGNDILVHATDKWPHYKRLSDNDCDNLSEICTMWGDWLYACDNIG
jgi:hypothetical protein